MIQEVAAIGSVDNLVWFGQNFESSEAYVGPTFFYSFA